MKTTWHVALTIGLLACFCCSTADAEVIIFTAITGDRYWDYGPNWNTGEAPDDGDTAVIPITKRCNIRITTPPAACDAIQVSGSLWLGEGSTLTIDKDSTIDGKLDIGNEAKLLIKDDVTIDGGGEIYLSLGTGQRSMIDEHDDGGTLTLDGNCTGGEEPACDLFVHGWGEIKVPLVNNALVVADECVEAARPTARLYLTGGAKSGDGVWSAKCNATLTAEVEVTGDGTWYIPDGDTMQGKIEIESECTELTGDVIMRAGELELQSDFCTTGDLTWESGVDEVYNTVTIDVWSDASASFAGSCSNN